MYVWLTILTAVAVSTQGDTLIKVGPGSISGSVTYADSTGVKYAIVTIAGTRRGMTTGGTGTFYFANVPPGRYAIEMDHLFERGQVDSVVVYARQESQVHFRLATRDPLSPARDLPIRQGDFSRYPRKNFAIRYTDGHGTRYDSFVGEVTMDLISNGDTTIAFRFSPEELDSLYDRVIAIRFFDLPTSVPIRVAFANSFGDATLTIRAGEQLKTVSWAIHGRPDAEYQDDWKRARSLVEMLSRMVKRRPEYRALPPPKGMYID
jgi:hypothetical protein